ncbi:unnamed protein product [Linum tenue]|uniref:Uncharacterized protein n=1 Tax=Linum tenue TaxID=586396 RepID=A0AAV0NJ98_9ROSI|nr:unnamed protein product [Linum tenue]CAI0458452.1 unnamed protein product [Linum tenue]
MHVCFLDFFIPILGEFGFSPFLLFSGLNGGRGEKRESPTETRPTVSGGLWFCMFDFLGFWCSSMFLTFSPFLFLGLIEGRKESPASEILRYWCERGKVDGRPFLLFRRWLRSSLLRLER